jgi:hypothetical protein
MQQLPILRLELCAAVLLAKLCGKATLAFTLPSINPSSGQISALCLRGSKDRTASETHLWATGLAPSKKTHLQL